jgi:hypothetical protein
MKGLSGLHALHLDFEEEEKVGSMQVITHECMQAVCQLTVLAVPQRWGS